MSKKINILQGQSTEDLMAELKSRGKFVDNLWTTEDVIGKFNCTEDEAQEVLYEALTNEVTMEQIWFAIRFHAEYEFELTEKDDTSY